MLSCTPNPLDAQWVEFLATNDLRESNSTTIPKWALMPGEHKWIHGSENRAYQDHLTILTWRGVKKIVVWQPYRRITDAIEERGIWECAAALNLNVTMIAPGAWNANTVAILFHNTEFMATPLDLSMFKGWARTFPFAEHLEDPLCWLAQSHCALNGLLVASCKETVFGDPEYGHFVDALSSIRDLLGIPAFEREIVTLEQAKESRM